MPHNIKKQTYVEADPKTQSALTFDLLDGLHKRIDELNSGAKVQVEACGKRFTSLEKQNKRDTARASIWGLIGGFFAIIFLWIKDYLTGG